MQLRIRLEGTPHTFAKTNLVTAKDKLGEYDTYICEDCGLEGRRRNLAPVLTIHGKATEEQINRCISKGPIKDIWLGKKIKMSIEGEKIGPPWKSLTLNSVHTIIKPPQGYFNSLEGVWVEGHGMRVKIFKKEYKIVKEEEEMVRTKFNRK